MAARSYIPNKLAEFEDRIKHLEQLLLVLTQPKPSELPRLLMPPMDVQERQEETARRLRAAIREGSDA